jgi:DNA polymerase delta subunit 3
MLYDYLTYQNTQKPDSVHATYLVYGIKREQKVQEDGDLEMSSSMPEHDSISEEVPTTTLALVREENLKGRRQAVR